MFQAQLPPFDLQLLGAILFLLNGDYQFSCPMLGRNHTQGAGNQNEQ
jgi:hypothetical protein